MSSCSRVRIPPPCFSVRFRRSLIAARSLKAMSRPVGVDQQLLGEVVQEWMRVGGEEGLQLGDTGEFAAVGQFGRWHRPRGRALKLMPMKRVDRARGGRGRLHRCSG